MYHLITHSNTKYLDYHQFIIHAKKIPQQINRQIMCLANGNYATENTRPTCTTIPNKYLSSIISNKHIIVRLHYMLQLCTAYQFKCTQQ